MCVTDLRGDPALVSVFVEFAQGVSDRSSVCRKISTILLGYLSGNAVLSSENISFNHFKLFKMKKLLTVVLVGFLAACGSGSSSSTTDSTTVKTDSSTTTMSDSSRSMMDSTKMKMDSTKK
jgi:hypothetical protein